MGSRKKKGDKFAQLKASEQAKRAAKVGGQAVATALGNEPASAGRGVEAAVESSTASDDSPVKQQVKQGLQVSMPDDKTTGLSPPGAGARKQGQAAFHMKRIVCIIACSVRCRWR